MLGIVLFVCVIMVVGSLLAQHIAHERLFKVANRKVIRSNAWCYGAIVVLFGILAFIGKTLPGVSQPGFDISVFFALAYASILFGYTALRLIGDERASIASGAYR